MNRFCLLGAFLCGGVFLHAQEFSAPARPVPIIEPAAAQSSDGSLVWTLDDLTQRRSLIAGGQADSTQQRIGVAFEPAKFDLVTLTYYSGADVFRQDAGIFDDLGDSSRVMMSWINKMSLALKLPAALTLSSYAQTGRAFADEQPGFSDSVKYGSALEWSPFKDVTKFQTGASTQETHGFDQTVLFENVYTVSLEQKLPATPLTLRLADSWTQSRVEWLPERDRDAMKLDAALLWKILPEAAWSAGLQSQDATFDLYSITESNSAVFTEFTLQPAPPFSITMRATREEKCRRDETKLLSNDEAFVFGLGLNWKLVERLSAGFGVQYRVPQAQAASTPATPNLPAFSISASAKF